MKKKQVRLDPFSERIMEILASSSAGNSNEKFKEMIVAEVRNYSREVQNTEAMPQLFTRLCDLIVDCRSAGIPDDSFRLLVAQLFYETSYSMPPVAQELQSLTGMDGPSIEAAREHLKEECVASILMKGGAVKAKKKEGDEVGSETLVN